MRQMTNRTWWQMALVLGVVLLLTVGCSKKVPQEVTDVNQALNQAKDACASVYAADDLAAVQSDADSMNAWVDQKKMKKAKKEAIPLQPKVDALSDTAASNKAAAEKAAAQAIADAEAAVKKAHAADAPKLAANEHKVADAKLAEAKAAAGDPCKYKDAAKLAAEAKAAAGKAEKTAIAEAKRIAEEKRKAEEARLAREAEERRKAEEAARLAAHPPTWTVEQGDSLWKITGLEKIYGHGKYWPIVYDANSGAIADPNLIYPGQELTIPRDIEEDQMDAKLHEMWGKYGSEPVE